MDIASNYNYADYDDDNRIVNILINARDSLSDQSKQRWSDSRLLRVMNEAQKIIALKSGTLREQQDLVVGYGTPFYDLPSDCHRLLRVAYKGGVLPLLSYEQMDKRYGDDWETHTGSTIEAVVFDKNRRGQIRVYPIVTFDESSSNWSIVPSITYSYDPAQLNTIYGVAVDSDYLPDTIDLYGVVTSVTYEDVYQTVGDDCICTGVIYSDDATFTSVYGVLGDMSDILFTSATYYDAYGLIVSIDGFNLLDFYGIWTDMTSSDNDAVTFINENAEVDGVYGIVVDVIEADLEDVTLTLYYSKRPAKIQSLSSEIETDPYYDIAMKHYIVGMALRDDKDTQNRAVGNEELQLAGNILEEAIRDNFTDFTSQNTVFETPYSDGFGQNN